jgi:large subunit ribosomal protein L22
MIAKSTLKYVRISPRKFRLIIPIVKGKNPEVAIAILTMVKKGASKYAIDMLKSAIANAKISDQRIDVSSLYISNMTADCGPTLKRFRAGSMGRASTIRKRTSHLTVELDVVKKDQVGQKTGAGQKAVKMEDRNVKKPDAAAKSAKSESKTKAHTKTVLDKEAHAKRK